MDPQKKKQMWIDNHPTSPCSPVVDEIADIKIPIEASIISDPLEHVSQLENIILPRDQDQLVSWGGDFVHEKNIAHLVQALQAELFLRRERRAIVVHSEGLTAKVTNLETALKKATEENSLLKSELALEKGKSAEKDEELVRLQLEINSWVDKLTAERQELAKQKDLTENIQLQTYIQTKAELMREFISHGGSGWDPQAALAAMDDLQKLMDGGSGSKDVDPEDGAEDEEESGEETAEEEEEDLGKDDQPKAD